MPKFAAATVAGLLSFAPIAALAATYTFVVPVTATQLPAGSTLQVMCQLASGPGGTGQSIGTAASQAIALIVNGAYKGNVTASMTTQLAAASYKCTLLVYQNGTIINVNASSALGVLFGGTATVATGWHGTIESGWSNF